VILSPGLNVCTAYVLMRFCHLINHLLVCKAKEGRHIRISCWWVIVCANLAAYIVCDIVRKRKLLLDISESKDVILESLVFFCWSLIKSLRVRLIVMLFNATSTIFLLYHGGQFYWWRKLENLQKTTDLP
jgi:hypothetical protein